MPLIRHESTAASLIFAERYPVKLPGALAVYRLGQKTAFAEDIKSFSRSFANIC